MTGIHPVTIRKYETNKMQPLPAQLERIAAALGVSYNALNGVEHAGLRFETIGDLMGVLMVLLKAGVLQIEGERDSDFLLKAETVKICFNPKLKPYFSLISDLGENQLSDILLKVKDKTVFNNLLIWEKITFLHREATKSAEQQPSDSAWAVVNRIAEVKEMVELQLQKSQIILTESGEIEVKIPPDWSKIESVLNLHSNP